jgi:hypothetical protein
MGDPLNAGQSLLDASTWRPSSDSGSDGDEPKRSSDYDVEDAEEQDAGPGPAYPPNCTVSGSGFSGGPAGTPVTLQISAKDAKGERLTHGGNHIVVRVSPALGTAALERPVAVAVTDYGNGNYAATYSVPARGNYSIAVEIDGMHITNSPFPVFFSPPGDTSTMVHPGAALPPPPPLPDAPPPVAEPPSAMVLAARRAIEAMGDLTAGEKLTRSLYIGNISKSVSQEDFKRLVSLVGRVATVEFLEDPPDTALVEFVGKDDMESAKILRGQMVGGWAGSGPGAACLPFFGGRAGGSPTLRAPCGGGARSGSRCGRRPACEPALSEHGRCLRRWATGR